MKQLMMILLTLTLVTGCATNTKKSFEHQDASDLSDTSDVSDVSVTPDESVVVTPSRAEELGVTVYRQDDKRWGNDKMGNSSETMKKSGCLTAAIAAAVTMNGHKMTPKKLNKLFKTKKVYDNEANIQWQQLRAVKHYNVQVFDETSRSILDACLKKKHYPVIRTKSLKSGNAHYVLIVHKDGDDYDVMDPKFDDLTRLSDYKYRIDAIRCIFYK